MSIVASQEQVYYLWVCTKCGVANPEEVIFCPNCASLEGLPNEQAAPANKTDKISEVLAGAIDWSLKNAFIKEADVLAHAAKRGRSVASIDELQGLPVVELDGLAGNFIGANRLGATGSGFGAGLPGGLAAFATIPADITAVVYFAMRCLSGISQSYGFERDLPAAQTVQLLAFAHSCRLETLVIGARRLDNLKLAYFLMQKPEYAKQVRACALKQLSAHLTVDFAKTSWATFLPIVGGVINGAEHFWFLGEVGNRSKFFYRSLLEATQPAAFALPPLTLEMRQIVLPLSSGPLEGWLVRSLQAEAAPLVLVLWEGDTGRDVGDKLAQAGFTVLSLSPNPSPDQLQEALAYLEESAEVLDLSLSKPPGLLAFGTATDAALTLAEVAPASLGAVVLYSPAGMSRAVRVKVPVLLHWGEKASEIDPTWPGYLSSGGSRGMIAISTYEGAGYDFTNPTSPDYNSQATSWAWADTFEWLKPKAEGL